MTQMNHSKILSFAALTTTLLGFVQSSTISAHASRQLAGLADATHAHYGPLAGRFWVAFPSKPKSDTNTPGLLENFPAGVNAYGYWVSPSKDVFGTATAPMPKAPTYMVAVGLFSNVAAATAYMGDASQGPGLEPVKVPGAQAYEFLGPEDSPLNQGNKLSDPHAIEGLLVVRRASTAYIVIAITMKRSTTTSFLTSFKVG